MFQGYTDLTVGQGTVPVCHSTFGLKWTSRGQLVYETYDKRSHL